MTSAAVNATDCPRRIRVLSYNIQAGIGTRRYTDYVTGSWRQLLPHHQHRDVLRQIAGLAGDFDIVGLQEADAGSLRTGFIDQTRFIAECAGFDFQHHQSNRRVGNLAHAGNGLMARWQPEDLQEYDLPGTVPGRGALCAWFTVADIRLLVMVVHLSLGAPSRQLQMTYLTEILKNNEYCIVLGDFNVSQRNPSFQKFLNDTGLQHANRDKLTFPAWQPQRGIDHLLVSPGLQVECCEVRPETYSDHLPLHAQISLVA